VLGGGCRLFSPTQHSDTLPVTRQPLYKIRHDRLGRGRRGSSRCERVKADGTTCFAASAQQVAVQGHPKRLPTCSAKPIDWTDFSDFSMLARYCEVCTKSGR
jgi:hypothetical protein